jgi:hypothetical protein
MGMINQFLQTLVYDYNNSYPGFFKKQRRGTGLDMFFDCEYSNRVNESIEKKYDLDSINL